jgi:hypothetical protein
MNKTNDSLLSRKWSKFLGLRGLFSFVPFLDFVIISGSLATGEVHKDSDFDVIVGARTGRIFTVRAFCIFIFGIFGARRKGAESKGNSSNKVCFSHFVTPAAYRLSPPHNEYWRNLYRDLIPVYGSQKTIEKFFEANSTWASIDKNSKLEGGILKYTTWNFFRIFWEFILHEFVGDYFEKFVKRFQLERIEKSLKRDIGYKPRLRFDDEELEFHPNTRRIEEMLKNN